MAEQELPSIKKNFLYSTLYQILGIISPFITAPYLSRVLGVEKIGIYSYTQSISYYFVLFSTLGTIAYGTREISRTRDDKELRSKLFFEIELLTVLTTTIAIAAWITFIIFNPQYRFINSLYIISLLSSMFNISWFYTGLEDFKHIVTKNSLVKISGIVLTILLVKRPDQLWLYVLILTSTDCLGNLSMWLSLKKLLVKVDFRSLNIWHHFKETLVYFIPSIATSIYLVLDKTLIGIITKETAQNGFYEEANKVLSLAKALCFSSITQVMGTRISYLFKENKIEEIKQKIEQTLDFIFFMSIGACFGLIGIAKNFIPFFFGEAFTPSIILLQVMSPILIIKSTTMLLMHLYYIPAGLRNKSCYFEVSGAILNLLLNVGLIYFFKSLGAVIATLASEILVSILYVVFSNRFLTLRAIFKYSWKKFVAASFMLAYLLFIQTISFPSYWLTLLAQIPIGVIIYVLILLLLKDSNTFKVFKKIFKHSL